jgi:hypothetical protein
LTTSHLFDVRVHCVVPEIRSVYDPHISIEFRLS